MKKIAVIVVSFALAMSLSFAQSKPLSRPGGSKPEPRVQKRSMEERMDAFAKILNLKPEQKSKVKSILEKQMQKQKAVANDKKLSTDDRRKKVQGLIKETNELIRKVLDKSQLKKFDDLLKQSEARRAKMNSSRPPIKP